jgi:hypothetical protein
MARRRPHRPPTAEPDEREAGDCAPVGLRQLWEGGRSFGAPAQWIYETRELEGIWYQLETVTCGDRTCRCMRCGDRHGPYWYAFWVDARTKRRRSAYVGKRWRRHVP